MDEKLQRYIVGFRLPIVLFFNIGLCAFGYLLALALRFDFSPTEILSVNRLVLPLAILLLFRSGAYVFFGLNQGYWKYFSTRDLVAILKAHLVSSFFFLAAVMFLRVPAFPRSVIFIELALSVLFSGGSRLIARWLCERFISPTNLYRSDQRQVLVLGGGDSGHLLVKTLQSNQRLLYEPVGVLDDSERLSNSQVHGVRVLGKISSLSRTLESMPRVAAVVLAIPSLSSARVLEIEKICQKFDVALKRLQAFEDIACLDAFQPRETLSIESVLEKEMQVEHEEEIRVALQGRRVLVTGAGGSIGAELVRQIIPFAPERVCLFDQSEYNLFAIRRELESIGMGGSHHLSYVIGDICDETKLLRVAVEEKPDVVFHAAAYKHVPLMEENCYEAFRNNVLGTRNLLNVCRHTGVSRFVFISTDKAVDPSSIMGCSKRISELLVQESRRDLPSGVRFDCATVRFGNVINSAGSVIPVFKEQILSGGPITVTHPEMERYFMSIREAVRLVLTAGTLGEEGETYILDMGEPIRIVEVAKKMRALYGRRDLSIVFTGTRPGEKLSERLTYEAENTSGTRLRKVRRVEHSQEISTDVFRWAAELEDQIRGLSDAKIGVAMRHLVTGLNGDAIEGLQGQALGVARL